MVTGSGSSFDTKILIYPVNKPVAKSLASGSLIYIQCWVFLIEVEILINNDSSSFLRLSAVYARN